MAMPLDDIELMIEELQALLKYENVLEEKRKSKSQVSFKRLEQRTEEWNTVSKEYRELKERVSEKIVELRRLLMKRIDIFENYYRKYGPDA
jgi:hypothetical protein